VTASRQVFFSVVVPTCNRHELLAACLRGLAPGQQSFAAENYEVIVSDDGAALSGGQRMKEQFPWARWIAGPRRGAAANRNFGAAHASGQWTVFVDDDCLPERGWLDAFASAARSTSTVTVLEGRTTCGVEALGALQTAPVNETGGLLWSCNFAMRTEVFRWLGGFDETLGSNLEDVDLRVRAERAGLTMQFVPAAIVDHPPRALRPLLRQVAEHRTYFQFARKHGTSVGAAGLNWRGFALGRYKILRRSRNVGEAVRFVTRTAVETLLVLPLCAWWAVSVRPKK
jgi:GT2 family glycosyltransferase